MDEREVTNGEYAAFLEAKNGDASGQPTECDWNTSFIPKFEEPNGDIEPHINECPKAAWNLETHPTHPVRCVDFCDAFAYCKWAGRRLCGETGATTGAVNSKSLEDVEKLALSTQSEWYNACSQGGNNTYPYGDDYVAGRCKDSARTDITNTSSNQCTGTVLGYQGIYDLSGSVEEWANFCFKDGCSIYGGSFISSNENSLTCTTFGLVHPTLTNVSVGFRCCADAIPEP